ncbi:2-dehydro-3-deoxy-D-arabinonate dehydratase [Lewinella marina]|uniref:2-hydroxyhepta-2,4-diene-1,7-dioate isomerase n=1 Tax=Neolewinella marina TaxID=438751 RepID=A0A2G0CDV5_9BACT|nr:fumarylacetoacetate hydrolase family protein [Neolewinella marina]NJB87539.1 2-dehydro-3-deoxy-D-arabinonate dehydratase [Neolewinella marina]PHK98156.1 2-hydroxyhepta-2,4-diene-1,7-dioate isomerase [Neolewinella marina]
MKLYNTTSGPLLESAGRFYTVAADWDDFVNDDNLFRRAQDIIASGTEVGGGAQVPGDLQVPAGRQEIWASGVTYFNSKLARQEESAVAGGGDFYERVYHADRPELFFKATPQRAVASGGQVRIRKDSTWDVPEPELTLLVTASGKIVGYTIGNDMSSRSIEGENPLYLPQAKTFDACAGLGPCVLLTEDPLPPETEIRMEVLRGGREVFRGQTTLNSMKRKPEELVEYLFRECSFPYGCLLMTGTGIVPGPEFTLASGDEIRITIPPIGTLINTVQ